MSVPSPIAWSLPGDRLADYCQWEYAPQCALEGKRRVVNLLYQSFAAADAPAELYAACAALQKELGAFNTVWGCKWAAGRLSWEFYFYDYDRLERRISIPRVLDILRPFAPCALSYSEARPYFMFSLDLDAEQLRRQQPIEELNIYLGNPSAQVSSGLSYSLSEEGLLFNNLYHFFDARAHRDEIRAKVACSAHLDLPGLDLAQVLWPELVDCGSIVVANKRQCDGVYFSRIKAAQLAFFLKRMAFPGSVLEELCAEPSAYDHLLFDVGFDYRMQGGQLTISKSAFYGLL